MKSPHVLPQYVQVSEGLIREISTGRLLPGDRLPPERKLATDLGIAVGTLRKALADMTEKGFLERKQGSGNYVRLGDSARALYSFFRLEVPEGGGTPTADVLSVARLEKPSDLPTFGTEAQGFRIRRLRYLNGAAMALEEIWLDGAYASEISAEALSHSLYHYYQEVLGLRIARVEDQLHLGEMPDWAASSLRPGIASGLVERKSWAQDGALAEISRTWFDTTKARYVARLR